MNPSKDRWQARAAARLLFGFSCVFAGYALPSSRAQSGQTLPYTTDFESSGGFTVGTLNGQGGWTVPQGDAEVVNTIAFTGTQSVALNPAALVTQATVAFAPETGQTVAYVDFYAMPDADPNVSSSSVIQAGGAEIGFLLSNGAAVVQIVNGNGSGGGTWGSPIVSTSLALAAGGNETAAWHRFTFREDFNAGTWDLYVDGQMIAYSINLMTSPTPYLTGFTMSGHAVAVAQMDTLYAGYTNPLFTNESNDGISDAWKEEYGLNPAQNLRNVSPSGNGIPLIQEYVTGANPLDYFSGRAIAITSPLANQIAYSYDNSGRISTAVFANVSSQAFTIDPASNVTTATTVTQPVVAWRTSNSLPPDGSGIGADSATPANDNLPNLAKYGLGLVPLTPAQGNYPSVILVQNGSSQCVAVQYACPSPAPADLTYVVEVSPDSQNWTNGPNATTTVSSTTSNGWTTVVVQDNTPISSPVYGRYIRLRIVRNAIQP